MNGAERDDNAIVGYVAFRHGAIVGRGPDRSAAYREAASFGLTTCEVWPANGALMARAKRRIESKRWTSEIELLRELMQRYVEGIDADWPYDAADEDELDRRLDAISDELAEAERKSPPSQAMGLYRVGGSATSSSGQGPIG